MSLNTEQSYKLYPAIVKSSRQRKEYQKKYYQANKKDIGEARSIKEAAALAKFNIIKSGRKNLEETLRRETESKVLLKLAFCSDSSLPRILDRMELDLFGEGWIL